MARKKITKKTTKKSSSRSLHAGRHPEHIAMMYRIGGGGIVIFAGLVLIFLAKYVFNL